MPRLQSDNPVALVEPVFSLPMATTSSERVSSTLGHRPIAGRGGDRMWQQDNETIEAFEARVEAVA